MPEQVAVSPDEHARQPFRVHELARDFILLDVWRFDVRGRADEFVAFRAIMADMEHTVAETNFITRALFGLRLWLGRWLRLDRVRMPLPIPGCTETSIASRMPGGRDPTEPRSEAEFHPVYEDERESLAEISNGTVHALMHLAWVRLGDGDEGFAPQMAVYVKHRGTFGRIYMAMIAPFRHWFVYPAIIAAVRRRWRERDARG